MSNNLGGMVFSAIFYRMVREMGGEMGGAFV